MMDLVKTDLANKIIKILLVHQVVDIIGNFTLIRTGSLLIAVVSAVIETIAS